MVQVHISGKEFGEYKKYCKENEIKFSGLVRLALREFLKND